MTWPDSAIGRHLRNLQKKLIVRHETLHGARAFQRVGQLGAAAQMRRALTVHHLTLHILTGLERLENTGLGIAQTVLVLDCAHVAWGRAVLILVEFFIVRVDCLHLNLINRLEHCSLATL